MNGHYLPREGGAFYCHCIVKRKNCFFLNSTTSSPPCKNGLKWGKDGMWRMQISIYDMYQGFLSNKKKSKGLHLEGESLHCALLPPPPPRRAPDTPLPNGLKVQPPQHSSTQLQATFPSHNTSHKMEHAMNGDGCHPAHCTSIQCVNL